MTQQPTLRIVLSDVERRERLAFAISEAMRRNGQTPPKVAKLVGKSAETVRRWRDGETTPDILDVAPLAEALGVRVDYLVTPPPVPDYPIEEYLVRGAAEDAVTEGIDRAQLRRDLGDE